MKPDIDRVILGKNCYLDGCSGKLRPNNNQIVVGCSGTGKSVSVMLPTILSMENSSCILTYSKPGEARSLAEYLESRGYYTLICDLSEPERSNISFDPLQYVCSYLDIEDLSANIVLANPMSNAPQNTYWNDSGMCLFSSLIEAVLMTKDEPCLSDVLDLFDKLEIKESGKGISTTLDKFFFRIKAKASNCPAVSNFADFQQLPYSTAGCVRDTLAKAIRRMFPEPIREMMRMKKYIDFERLATERTALFIITSPINTSLYFFANILFATAIRKLLEYAQQCENQHLPRPVRLYFDDFACGAPINDYPKYISIFRAAGISAMMLFQSESQLNELYSYEGAATILNNCSSYAYFPGGMDLATCQSISRRLDKPMTEVMYMPGGNVIIMQNGEKPVVVPRYDTFHSKLYLDYQEFVKNRQGRMQAEK